jgi:hypothetical protein
MGHGASEEFAYLTFLRTAIDIIRVVSGYRDLSALFADADD